MQMCVKEGYVKRVGTGQVELSQGADGGDAVYFEMAGTGLVYALHSAYNMDSERGQAMHRELLTALAARIPISAYDASGSNCKVVDALWVHY